MTRARLHSRSRSGIAFAQGAELGGSDRWRRKRVARLGAGAGRDARMADEHH